MDRILIRGGRPLCGEIEISGSKNAALPLLAAALLTPETLRLSNLPRLADIASMRQLLETLGTEIREVDAEPDEKGMVLEVQAAGVQSLRAPYDLVRKMRASVLVLGPLLARFGRAEVSLPGGCAIGTRPVDLHLKALEAMGASFTIEAGYIRAEAARGLRGGDFAFPMVSVGATENAMMAAALADGESRLVNVARGPEIVDLANCLNSMGAEVRGAGSDTITVRGAAGLHGTRHAVIADRIEAGTFLMAAAITDGNLRLQGAEMTHLERPIELLRRSGTTIAETNSGIHVHRTNGPLVGSDVMTEAFPGFATDLQAQFMALMTTAAGASMITETIFENRFMHVPELQRMGANITVHGASALVRGQERLMGAEVMATDLRASVCLVLAGLAAEGETLINRVYHLDRGYERIEAKLAACGAEIERLAG